MVLILLVVVSNLSFLFSLARGNSYKHLNGRAYSKRLSSSLHMSDPSDPSLLDQMQKTLGESNDIFADAKLESKQLMKGLRDMDRDPGMRVNNKFLDWLTSNGVYVKSESSWGRAQHPLVISSNTEDDGESCGRGLLAKDGMGEGELMMTIPLDLCLTRLVAQEMFGKAAIPDYMDEYIAIALLLITEKLKGEASNWKPYLDILPTKEGVNPSYVWTEEELDMLKGSPCYFASKSLKAKIEKEYAELCETTFKRNAKIFPVEKFTIELFTWAFVMLLSRAARLTSKLTGEELALVPYADLMNHNPYSNTYIDAQRSGMPLISRLEEVAVYADRPYKKFEQVFINYGEKGNADLLLLYGFALERNPFDAVDISVGLSREDPLFGQKKIFLDKAGRGVANVRFPLQRDRYPSELVDFLRLLLVEPEDLGMQPLSSTNFNEPISPSLERRVLSTMVSICQSYIEQYPTTVEQDDKIINDRAMFNLFTRQQRMAIKLRASEKRILFNTITAVTDELDKLPTIVNDMSEMVAAGRSFDALAYKATVTNAKGMGDWVDKKGVAPVAVPTPKKSVDAGDEDAEGRESIAERRRKRRVGR